jgi:hypothetical protein
MIVRIRFRHGPVPRKDPNRVTPQELAHGASMLLAPVYLCAWAMALWRIGADMRVAAPFFLSDGVFSHWQVWFAVAGALQAASISLRRRAVRQE